MLVISTTNYADFKTVAASLRKVDRMFYNQSAAIPWLGSSNNYTVAYAFDMEKEQCVVLQAFPASQFVPTDFPSAIQISGHLMVADISSVPGTANPF